MGSLGLGFREILGFSRFDALDFSSLFEIPRFSDFPKARQLYVGDPEPGATEPKSPNEQTYTLN